MNKITAQVETVLKVFLAAVVGMAIANGANVLGFSHWSDWRPYVAAGVAAVLVWAYNYLNPANAAYGVGSK